MFNQHAQCPHSPLPKLCYVPIAQCTQFRKIMKNILVMFKITFIIVLFFIVTLWTFTFETKTIYNTLQCYYYYHHDFTITIPTSLQNKSILV